MGNLIDTAATESALHILDPRTFEEQYLANQMLAKQLVDCPVCKRNAEMAEKSAHGNYSTLNMLANSNQEAAPDQPFPLPTDREVSSIPKLTEDGSIDYWVYPSQQMFWNSMVQKGWQWKEDNIKSKDIAEIIKQHNDINEKAWLEVLKWEALHEHGSGMPRLKSFVGKSTQYSPRAIMNRMFGKELPFDRHDWIVDRGGQEVKYVIDYYRAGTDDENELVASVDVRPAMNSLENFWDRLKVALERKRNSTIIYDIEEAEFEQKLSFIY